MDTLKGKQIMVWTFMGNTSMYQALRENTGGVQDKFLSELVRIMEKYPWCDGVDIDLEKGDDYSTAAKSTAMFRNIYNTVKSYNPAKLMNICLPDMDSINGSVGGENWCVYGDLNNYCDTASIMSYGMTWAGSAPGPVSPRSWLEGMGQRKRFSDGKVCVPYSHFLGYDKGEDGGMVLNEEEAKIVRRIYGLFLKAANAIFGGRDSIREDYEAVKERLYDISELEAERIQLQEEMHIVAEMIQQCVNENARIALDQTEYQKKYDGLANRFDRIKERLETVGSAITERMEKREKTERFLTELEKRDGPLTEFNEEDRYSLVEYATVYSREDIRFTFKNGLEIRP